VSGTDAPYVAVVFSSVHSGVDVEGYAVAASRMEQLAAAQPGYRGLESARGEDGFGITVSYWATEDDALAWKRQSEHVIAQATGRSTWYTRYVVRVAAVTREYSYDADVDPIDERPDECHHERHREHQHEDHQGRLDEQLEDGR
jgi:heme-degrading monooxygenase HmoA